MKPQEKALELVDRMFEVDVISTYSHQAKGCALIAVDEILLYHESLFDKGFKDVHIAPSSPILTYVDIMNPLLKYWQEVKSEIEKI